VAEAAVSLRPWRRGDAAALAAAWADPDIVAGSQPPEDRSVAAAERWIAGCSVREERLLAIDRVLDVAGECVGEVGASNVDHRRGAALLGWWVASQHRARGHATAGIGLMCDLLFEAFGLRALIAEIAPENEASIRLAVGLGFEPLRAATADSPAAYVLRRA